MKQLKKEYLRILQIQHTLLPSHHFGKYTVNCDVTFGPLSINVVQN